MVGNGIGDVVSFGVVGDGVVGDGFGDVEDGVVKDRAGDVGDAVVGGGVGSVGAVGSLCEDRAVCPSSLGDLSGHDLRRAAPQGSRLASSDPCLGKEHLSVGCSSRTLAVRSSSGGYGRVADR